MYQAPNSPTPAHRPQPAAAPKPQPQLLDLLGDDEPPCAAAPPPWQQQQQVPPAPPRDPFETMTTYTQPAVQEQVGCGGPVAASFSGAQPAAAVPTVAATAAESRPPLDDFFSSLALGSTTVPPVPPVPAMAYRQQQDGYPQQGTYSSHPGFGAPAAGYAAAPMGGGPRVGPGVGPPVGNPYTMSTNTVSTMGLPSSAFGGNYAQPAAAAVSFGGPAATAAAAPSWSHVATPGSGSQPLKPSVSLNENSAFDFVKDHLK